MNSVDDQKHHDIQKKLLVSWSKTIKSKQALRVELDGLVQLLIEKDNEIARLSAELQQLKSTL